MAKSCYKKAKGTLLKPLAEVCSRVFLLRATSSGHGYCKPSSKPPAIENKRLKLYPIPLVSVGIASREKELLGNFGITLAKAPGGKARSRTSSLSFEFLAGEFLTRALGPSSLLTTYNSLGHCGSTEQSFANSSPLISCGAYVIIKNSAAPPRTRP